MRLIYYTQRHLAFVLFLVIAFWACFFYFRIIDEVNDETDDTLENYRKLIIQRAVNDTAFLHRDQTDDIMTKHFFREISAATASRYKEHFIDSLMFVENEMEFDPVRVLKTAFRTGDGKFYELIVMTSILEKDDLIEAIWWWTVILYLVLMLCILLVTHLVFAKSLRPLHHLLRWLDSFTLGHASAPLDHSTHIQEFQKLNRAIRDMAVRNERVFQQQKQFIENASHELQTPLAICQNKLEMLAENAACTEQQLQEIGELHTTLGRIIKLNKSLLLLSRIENDQFSKVQAISFNPLLHQLNEDLQEIYETKRLTTSFQETGVLTAWMNESLASALVTNLLKNAYLHSLPRSAIRITITANSFTITNTGHGEALDKNHIFKRFYHQSNKKEESTGLGLAIVHSITAYYQLKLNYDFDGEHHFSVLFPPVVLIPKN